MRFTPIAPALAATALLSACVGDNAKHEAADVTLVKAIERRFDAIENRQSKFRGWLIGLAAGGGATGAMATKLLAAWGT